jgi:hypothetical protein
MEDGRGSTGKDSDGMTDGDSSVGEEGRDGFGISSIQTWFGEATNSKAIWERSTHDGNGENDKNDSEKEGTICWKIEKESCYERHIDDEVK